MTVRSVGWKAVKTAATRVAGRVVKSAAVMVEKRAPQMVVVKAVSWVVLMAA